MEKEMPPKTVELKKAAVHIFKVKNVLNRRVSLGISAHDLSFLLGKANTYVRDVENPFTTLKYNIDDTALLCQVLQLSPSEIYQGVDSSPIALSLNIMVYEYKFGEAYEVYQVVKGAEEKLYEIIPESKDPDFPVESKASLEEIHDWVDELFSSTYFDMPRTAWEMYDIVVEKFGFPVKAKYLRDAVKKYTSKRSYPKLSSNEKSKGFFRTLYRKDIGDGL
ncbi:hypothetical protein GCM10011339_35980 [Echinicola rosea]|uniref:XRE family transcriptional regulator n=2 Tax=Echinicola rosea TaxID=1807691 RepID=A0ABQ1VA41_9BACT|nr:hypothetical protein GCM10011339_35980 [Echinicola rosea]